MTKPAAPPAAPINRTLSVPALIGLALVTRFISDTGVQLFFPFLPVIAAGLGVTAVTLGRLVSIRSSTGLLSPIFGTLADRYGYRRIMRIGLVMAGVGYLLIAVSSAMWTAAIGMILAGLGTFSFVPNLQAYLSARLPYHQRARGLAIPEYGWALSGILGLWAMGELIELTNWRVPFYLVGGTLLLTAWAYRLLPSAREARPPAPPNQPRQPWWQFFQLGENGRSAWAVLAAAGLIMYAGMSLFINYGTWLVDLFALGPAALGRVALIMGIADLGGSGLVSLVGDRWGKRRMAIGGTLLGAVTYFVLPQFAASLAVAIVGLVLVRFSFETSVVSNLTLLSEQAPTQRGKIMTLGAAAALLGSTLAGLLGPWFYTFGGIATAVTTAAVASAIAALLLWRFSRETAP